MRTFSNEGYSNVFGVVYLGLMTNVLVLTASLPLVLLLVTTDPMRSWLLLAVAAALAAPAGTAAFTVFGEYTRGSTTVARDFVAGLRATWRPALAVGGMLSCVVVVLFVDVRALSGTGFALVAIPVLLVLVVLTFALGLHALVAVAEQPHARLRDTLRASVYLSLQRWPLSALSLTVLALQMVFFTSFPALALGVTGSGALYIVWANSRFALQPVLGIPAAPNS